MRKSKNLYFYNIFVSPGDAPVAITQNVSQMKRQFSACQTPRSMYPSIFNSFPVIRTASANKSPFSRTAAHIFVSSGDALAIITQYVARMERQFSASQTSCSTYLSIFNSFRVIRCLSQCVSPKIAIFYHTLGSPGDAPGAITLNVVWMEREFDAYKLSRCMYPFSYNRFWDRARYSSKIVIFSIPLCIRRPR